MRRLLASQSVRVNTAANFVAQFLAPALGIVTVPIYLRYIGLSGYGLVSLLGALLVSMEIFTRGLGWSLQRETARAHDVHNHDRLRALVSTFELGYWGIGAVLGALLAALSGPISHLLGHGHGDIGTSTIRTCLLILAIRIASVFPLSIYEAALRGLRRQVLLNVINGGLLLVSTVTMIAVVAASRSVVALYVVDLGFAIGALLVFRSTVARVPEVRDVVVRRHLSREELKSLLGLSAGLIWVQGTGMAIKQADRYVLGALTSLSSLGVYTAGVAGGKLLSLSYNPFLTAVFPESCALAQRNRQAMPNHLIRNSKIVALTSMGLGIPIALSAHQLLSLWTRNARVTSGGTSVLVVYLIGSLFLAQTDTQGQTQTALGTARCSVVVNSLAVIWLPAVMYLLVSSFGIVGAAWTWCIYGFTGWVAFTGYTFARLLRGGLDRYLRALAVPAVVITAVDSGFALTAHAVAGSRSLVYVGIMVPGAVVGLAAAAAASLGPRVMLRSARRFRRPRWTSAVVPAPGAELSRAAASDRE